MAKSPWSKLKAYALAKPGAWEDDPWGDGVVVKVGSKIFAFLGTPGDPHVGVKAAGSRDEADEWLARYPEDAVVMPYIGRSGWNTYRVGGSIPEDELLEAIDLSYDLVVSKLPKRERPAP
jgi:predicted DNA-binding protein (MmcQ/YjbR family)